MAICDKPIIHPFSYEGHIYRIAIKNDHLPFVADKKRLFNPVVAMTRACDHPAQASKDKTVHDLSVPPPHLLWRQTHAFERLSIHLKTETNGKVLPWFAWIFCQKHIPQLVFVFLPKAYGPVVTVGRNAHHEKVEHREEFHFLV